VIQLKVSAFRLGRKMEAKSDIILKEIFGAKSKYNFRNFQKELTKPRIETDVRCSDEIRTESLPYMNTDILSLRSCQCDLSFMKHVLVAGTMPISEFSRGVSVDNQTD
jgi:hypothetical protein